MCAVWLIVAIVNAYSWLLPHPSDQDGCALRIHSQRFNRPMLAFEHFDSDKFAVALINRTGKPVDYIPFAVCLQTYDLTIRMIRPDGTMIRSLGPRLKSDIAKVPKSLAEFGIVESHFSFAAVGYYQVGAPGEYPIVASLLTPSGRIKSPEVKLKVIEVTADAILGHFPIPPEGPQAKWPSEKQARAAVQQIKIGEKTWLFYRKFRDPEGGGEVDFAHRIAELPGKCGMKVEGAFGDNGPLTITYKAAPYHKFTTALVINSTDGRPWTAEDEKHRQSKLKKLAAVPEKN